jgi:iron complex outermembrane receptor protein
MRSKLLVVLTAMMLAAGTLLPARAQQIEEVVVTAQKREENVQEVPISISTYSGEFLDQSGIDTLQDLGDYAPNLTLSTSSNIVNNRIIMRGVGSVGDNALEPSVAVFIDGVYYPRTSALVGSLTDIEQVEVLRGPQGTLFGRNASMGALNIRTRAPSDEFEGELRGSYGNYDALRVDGSVSGPINDMLSGRLAFHHSNRDGYGDNNFLNAGNHKEFGDWEDLTVRGKLYFEPTADLSATITVDYASVDNEGNVIEVKDDTVLPGYAPIISAVLSPTGPFQPTGPVPEMLDDGDYHINQDHRDQADDEQYGISADISWKVGSHTIRSITAYRDWSNESFESALRLPADLFNRVSGYDAETISQEVQLLSPTDGRFQYVAGLYYYDEDYRIDQNFDLGADFCSPAVGNLVTATAARTLIPTLTAAFTPLIGAGLAQAVATGIVVGAITTPAQLVALGVPAPLAPVLLAAAPSAPTIGGAAAASCAAGPQTAAVDGEFRQDVTSLALFGQLTVNVTDQLRLTGGLRWTSDEKDGSFDSIINNPIVAPPSPTNPFGLQLRAAESAPDLKFDDNELTWMVNVSYFATDDIMLFGSYSTGFKSGGFNSEGANRPLTVDERVFGSETVDNWELGMKSMWFDQRLVANLTWYHTEISDFQDRQFDGVNFIVQNAGQLTQQGIELDLQARPMEPLTLLLGVSYLDSEFDEFPNATNLPAIVAATQAMNRARLAAGLPPLPVPPQDLKGERNHFSPEWQLSLSAEWADALPNTNLGWFVRGEYQFVDDQNVGAETNANPQSIQRGYDLVNARIGLRGSESRWELSAFVRNAFDQEFCQTIFNQPIGTTLGLVDAVSLGGMQRCVLGTPQTWGVEAAYRF